MIVEVRFPLLFLLICLAWFLGGVLNLSRWPPLWWDEGWTMNVARNWVEFGHYGQMNAGQPAPPGLSAAFPVVIPVALSFKAVGIGAWQARLPGVLFLFASLLLLSWLGLLLYNRRVSLAVLAVLLLMSGFGQLHPLQVGRAVLGEMPMLFLLLAGWSCLLGALNGRSWLLLPAMLLFGMGINAKSQALPFWLASLLLPLIAALWKGWRREALILASSIGGGWIVAMLLLAGYQILLIGGSPQAGAVEGLLGVTAFVMDPGIRWNTLRVVLTLGLPLLAGLLYAAWGAYYSVRLAKVSDPTEIIRLCLLGFSSSWLLWYTLFSIGWDRYLFPATFVGSVFVAALLDNLTGGFDFKAVVLRASVVVLQLRPSRDGLQAWLAIGLAAASLPLTVAMMGLVMLNQEPRAVESAAAYLNQSLPPGSVVETYESELLPFLDVPYHFPPDPVHVEIARRRMLDPDLVIDYDPLEVDPEYLVTGDYDHESGLYNPYIEGGLFHPIQSYPGYEIYVRNR